MLDLANHSIEVSCPNCEKEVSVSVGNLQAETHNITCNHCGTVIPVNIENPDDIKRMIKSADDLDDGLSKLFKGS